MLSVNLEDDEDLDLVDAQDVVLRRFLGDGGFATVREGLLHHTRVAVKIIKQQQGRCASHATLLPISSQREARCATAHQLRAGRVSRERR